MQKKLRVFISVQDTELKASCIEYPDFIRYGCDWNEVKANFEKGFEQLDKKEMFPKGYRLVFSLDLEALFEKYYFFNITELANKFDINKDLLYQYKDKVKFPSEKQSLIILRGLSELVKPLRNL